MLRFGNPTILHLLWLLPLLILFYLYAFRIKQRALARFGNPELLKKLMRNTSRKRQVTKISLILIAVCFMIFSLARPQIGTKVETVKREGIDILVAIDVSKSMLARDIQPSRLEKAKHEVESLIHRLEGDRIGLIAFAGVPFVQCPLTLDYGAASIFLDIMDPALIPTPGTAIGAAIEKAMQTFDQKERKHKVLILITDGEDHKGKALDIAKQAEREGIKIYAVGIGSPKGEPIPAATGSSGFEKDREGQVIITKLDEMTLEKIALQTGGKYFRATSGESELDRIYDDISKMEKKELGSLKYSQFEDRFQYLVIIALILLLVEFALSERVKVKREWRGRFM
ncbi:MAG: VWA domain-containing protein [candidate division KSB1 bacterium]|nr:VWA domain-containing protein [candidate division KSB1 bacterium]